MSLTRTSAKQLSGCVSSPTQDQDMEATSLDFPIKPPVSLAISPNLQALLEYDERVRKSSESHSTSRPSTACSQLSPTFQPTNPDPPLTGLPPPRRKKKSITSARDLSKEPLTRARTADIWPVDQVAEDLPASRADDVRMNDENPEVFSREMNPYINPAPEVETGSPLSPMVFAGREGRSRTSSSSSLESFSYQELREAEAEIGTIQRTWNEGQQSPRVEKVMGRTQSSCSSSAQGHNRNRSFSTRSEVSATTWEPSSSPEPHISISSTFYSGSVHSLAFTSMASRPDHGSFIEISRPYPASSNDHSLDSAHFPPLPSASIQRAASPGSASYKPQVPTTPKPHFNRPGPKSPSELPTTGNSLSFQERAELIRKTRKLTQVFGQIPHAIAVAQGHDVSPPWNSDGKKGRHWGVWSVSNGPDQLIDDGVWPPHEHTLYMSGNGRRYSAPLTPREFSFLVTESESRVCDLIGIASRQSHPKSGAGSPVSFIDLSDDDSGIDTPRQVLDPHRQTAFSQFGENFSLESLSLEKQADEQRRRKRDKLAKLHRFLGSRVPPELALGFNYSASLPPLATEEDEGRRFRGLRLRSSPISEHTMTYVDKADRLRSELDIGEKAVNVRRAAKMEKVFGIAPPQTLYHTRPASGFSNQFGWKSSDNTPATTPVIHNFKFDAKGKKTNRPGTAESSQQLIPKNVVDDYSRDHEPAAAYHNYRESLNSLNDIIDRDDKESLERLHEIMHCDAADRDSPLQAFARRKEYKISSRMERRRSLPSQPSITSLSSEYSIAGAPPERSPFEVKRRRAAKLTNFFGVSHRDIIDDILESIKKGVEEDSGNGTLNPDQANDLLQKLGKLQTRPDFLHGHDMMDHLLSHIT